MIAKELEQPRSRFEETGQLARVFRELEYRLLDTWSRVRRVVAEAEHLEKGAKSRFVVTSFSLEDRPATAFYKEDQCSRGEIEDRIKEKELHLFADRTSAGTMQTNQSGCTSRRSRTCSWRR